MRNTFKGAYVSREQPLPKVDQSPSERRRGDGKLSPEEAAVFRNEKELMNVLTRIWK